MYGMNGMYGMYGMNGIYEMIWNDMHGSYFMPCLHETHLPEVN